MVLKLRFSLENHKSMKKSLLIIGVIFWLISGNVGDVEAYHLASGSSASLKSEISITQSDHRVKILEDYLLEIGSPLSPHAKNFVESADKYDLDWRLLVSIAGLESGYGKHQPANSHNGWGWGYNNGSVKHFVSWNVAIDEISRGLREGYLKEIEGSDPFIIGPTYASSPTWAARVSYNMEKIEGYRARNATSTLVLNL